MNDFSENLRRYRLARKLTLNDVARAMGVSKPTVWAWEHARSRPQPDRHSALADILQVPVEVLVRTDVKSAAQSQVVRECREKIAEAFDLDVSAVRIRIEL